MTRLPFKIAGMDLPMITHTGDFADGIATLADRIDGHYRGTTGASAPQEIFVVVTCGEVVDRLGYAHEVLSALLARGHAGYYFTHRSGETYKRHDTFGEPRLLEQVAAAKAAGKLVVFVAVGGGLNGNTTGVVAALTNAHMIEVPTTPLHYNDATTSAKKAFSLVCDGKILAKNILGTFYLPRLVFCINEAFLTCSSSSIHSTVGESTKTMNMLGLVHTKRRDYASILGASEFASDTTSILHTVAGFELLLDFIEQPATRAAKEALLAVGAEVSAERAALDAAVARGDGPHELAAARAALERSVARRRELAGAFRARFYALGADERAQIDGFLTTVNAEIVMAKGMFLAYEDPLEKYRALLFEYGHTLGHAVEATLNGIYMRAAAAGIDAEAATRGHGQCVGMAVLWAGHMAGVLGELAGAGLAAHQALVYLFNSRGGFSFGPVRALCERLGVSRREFVESCIGGVRLDNKRGYVACAECESVDQIVCGRPGRMVRSADHNAEVRYLVKVDEALQRDVLGLAWDGAFDKEASLDEHGALAFAPPGRSPRSAEQGVRVADAIKRSMGALCDADEGTSAGSSDDESSLSRVSTVAADLDSFERDSPQPFSFGAASFARFGADPPFQFVLAASSAES